MQNKYKYNADITSGHMHLELHISVHLGDCYRAYTVDDSAVISSTTSPLCKATVMWQCNILN